MCVYHLLNSLLVLAFIGVSLTTLCSFHPYSSPDLAQGLVVRTSPQTAGWWTVCGGWGLFLANRLEITLSANHRLSAKYLLGKPPSRGQSAHRLFDTGNEKNCQRVARSPRVLPSVDPGFVLHCFRDHHPPNRSPIRSHRLSCRLP